MFFYCGGRTILLGLGLLGGVRGLGMYTFAFLGRRRGWKGEMRERTDDE